MDPWLQKQGRKAMACGDDLMHASGFEAGQEARLPDKCTFQGSEGQYQWFPSLAVQGLHKSL